MMTRLADEHYKGKTISFVHKIIGTKQGIIGRWWFEGKIQQISGNSKVDTYKRIKRIIDKY